MKYLRSKWLWVIIIVCVANISGFVVLLQKSVEWVDVVVANSALTDRHLISEDDVSIKQIPKSWLSDDMVTHLNQLSDVRVARMTHIPAGSIIYKSHFESSDLSSNSLYQLYEHQVAVPFSTDLNLSLGNTVTVGQYVDLLLVLSLRNQPTMVDWIFKDVRILAIKDRNGLNMDEAKAQKIPALILFAINQSDAQDFYRAQKAGQIRLVAHGLDRVVADEALKNESSECWSQLYE